MKKLVSTKKRVFISLVGPSETEKSNLTYNWFEIETFQSKIDKNYFFHQNSKPLYYAVQKRE